MRQPNWSRFSPLSSGFEVLESQIRFRFKLLRVVLFFLRASRRFRIESGFASDDPVADVYGVGVSSGDRLPRPEPLA